MVIKNKKVITIYLLGTFSVTFLVWGIILICQRYEFIMTGTIGFWVLFSIGGLASTVFGAYLSKKTGKVKSYRGLIGEIFKIKQSPKYYMLILIFFTVFFGIPSKIGTSENWHTLVLLILQMIFFGGLEEVGWRYIFQPALEKHMPYVFASIITGCLWAIWHLPLFFMEGMNKGSNFGLFAINVLALSFMLGAIYRVSKSLWLCVLFHAMVNAFSSTDVFMESMLSPLIKTIIIFVLSFLIVVLHYHYADKRIV